MTDDEVTRRPRPLSRRDAARMIGCSTTHVMRMERAGRIRAERVKVPWSGRVRVRLDPDDVGRVRRELAATRSAPERRAGRRPWTAEEGKVAARAFEMIAAGRTLAEIVVACEVPPHVVRELRDEYRRTFEDEDRERERERRAREERAAQREHDRRRALEDREDRRAREARAAKRRGAPTDMRGAPPEAPADATDRPDPPSPDSG